MYNRFIPVTHARKSIPEVNVLSSVSRLDYNAQNTVCTQGHERIINIGYLDYIITFGSVFGRNTDRTDHEKVHGYVI